MQSPLIKSALTFCAWLPLPLLHGLGTSLGWVLFLRQGHFRKIAEINISLCYPELSTQQQRKLVRACLACSIWSIVFTLSNLFYIEVGGLVLCLN